MSDPFLLHRHQLEEILSDLGNEDVLRDMIAQSLKAPLLSLDAETAVYEKLLQAENIEAREQLIDAFSPFAITAAWPYRYLGVPLPDLIAAARHRLAVAAYAFRPKRKSDGLFHEACAAILDGILDKLDEEGVELVDPLEVQRLLRDGERDKAMEVLDLLTPNELHLLESKFGQFADNPHFVGAAQYWIGESALWERRLSIAKRKLRLPKR